MATVLEISATVIENLATVSDQPGTSIRPTWQLYKNNVVAKLEGSVFALEKLAAVLENLATISNQPGNCIRPTWQLYKNNLVANMFLAHINISDIEHHDT